MRLVFRILGLAVALAGVCGCASSDAQTVKPPASAPAAPSPERIRELRAQADALWARRATSSAWSKLPADVLFVLGSIAQDASAGDPPRQAAIAAMAWVNNPGASDELRTLVSSQGLSDALRISAAFALAQREGRASVPALRPLLGAPQPELRVAAAKALGNLGGDDARSSLEDRLTHEDDPSVRETLQRSLTALQP